MGKRKWRSQKSETLISCRGRRGGEDKLDNDETVSEEEKGGFFACYLLTSLSPRHKGHTYIGFTVSPRRRIRQHNGEIRSGAWRTKTKRPWEMVMCIYGFPTNVSALQFEWAWQHPTESLAARKAAATFKSLSGLANKIKLGFTMLTLPAWQNLHLTVNFFSTKYTKHSAGCPSLPEHTRVQVGSMDDLPCYTETNRNMHEDENELGDDDEMCGNIRGHWKGRIEEIGTGQSGDLLSSTEDHRGSSFIATSPVQVMSSLPTGTFSVLKAIKDRDVFSLIDESRVEPDLPASKELPTADQLPIRNPIFPCEVEVIDLLSPSPGYRISSSSKRRKVSNVCPEIIDLTRSPIFV